MPLPTSSSDKAREEAVKAELAAKKDPKQAEAIAYANQRRMKAKGYADGGEITAPSTSSEPDNTSLDDWFKLYHSAGDTLKKVQGKSLGGPVDMPAAPGYADGGPVSVGGVTGDSQFARQARATQAAMERKRSQAEATPAVSVSSPARAGQVMKAEWQQNHAPQGQYGLAPHPADTAPVLDARATRQVLPPLQLAHGGAVPSVPHHESASLRWPLAHLSEQSRRQRSYALGLHLQHHFADGGVAGATTSEPYPIDLGKLPMAEASPEEVNRVATKYGQKAPDAPESLQRPDATPRAPGYDEWASQQPDIEKVAWKEGPKTVPAHKEPKHEERPSLLQPTEPRLPLSSSELGQFKAPPDNDQDAKLQAVAQHIGQEQQRMQNPAYDAAQRGLPGLPVPAVKPNSNATELPNSSTQVPNPTAAPVQTPKQLSTEEQIEKERQEERYAALHPSVFNSIRRHLGNGLTAFGGGTPIDYAARDRAAAKDANDNAIQRLAALHGNQDQAHKLAEQSPESARSFAVKTALSKTLGVPVGQFANLAQEDMGALAQGILAVQRSKDENERAAATQALAAQYHDMEDKQKTRALDIQQQKANAAGGDVAEKRLDRQDKELQPMAAQLSRVTQPTRVLLDAADRAAATLDVMQKSGQATSGQVQIFLNELDKLSSGGAATEYGTQGLDVKTIQSQLAGLAAAVTGSAQDSGKLKMLAQQYGPMLRELQAANQRAYGKRVDDVTRNYSYLKGNPRYQSTIDAVKAGRPAGDPADVGGSGGSKETQDLLDQGIPLD